MSRWARNLDAISDFPWVHLLHVSCSSCGRILELACFLWILQHSRPSADSFCFVFPNMVLTLKIVVSLSPTGQLSLHAY